MRILFLVALLAVLLTGCEDKGNQGRGSESKKYALKPSGTPCVLVEPATGQHVVDPECGQ